MLHTVEKPKLSVVTKEKLLKNVICPDGQSECPDGNTCCKLSSGQWGCCPLPNAVCCSDGVHCCPNGYTCNVSAGTCSKGSKLIPMLQKMPASKGVSEGNVVCPDGQSECPDGNTCCKLSSGQWGCCPLPSAVCCSDGEHCCPNGYTCDVSAGTCSKGSKLIPMLEKIPALQRKSQVSIVCPDGQSECPDGNTCCKLSSGQWGCCPLPKAVCCSDGVHCCPNGYTCDVSEGTCSKGRTLIPMLQKTQASKRNSKVGVVCPGGQSECPDGNTCCKLSSGQWGCCPLPNAVCCSDGVHCCPNGYTCNVSAGTCSKGSKLIPMLQKMPASKGVSEGNVVCPDGQSECPDGNTCCKLSSGQWGCCPLPSAVCCSDGEHCCPNGYTCDVSAGTCSKGSKLILMLEKIPALQRKSQVSIVCPDGQSECPDGNTCCKLSSGQWGCCPLPKAVCCSDGVHCCPNGYTCDVSEGTCSKGRTLIPMLQKTRASKRNSKVGVVCPGGQSECPDGNTCCKLSSGQWGCCPLPNAVCCSDGEHCCPNGYTCDVSEGTCSKGSKLIPMLQKMPALKGSSEVSVVCPDGQSECPDGNTCCKLSSGQWGCCPLPKAVCCSDGEHCCPNGYTCDVSAGTCSKGSKLVPMLEKIPALQRKSQVSIVCPDGQSECPDGNTCCKLSSGQWGCCPLPKAVCCSDGVHCCPNGYTCDVSEGTCSKGRTLVPMLQKMRASKRNSEVSVVCPDGQSECPDGNTCCKLSSGQWGCCPLPNAVCCSDGEHCCPNGYTCDVSAGTCSKGSKLIPMLQKMPASKGVSEGNVVCPDGQSECPDGNTCCKLSSGQWGCCPLPNAVCCSDGEHCCPNGYTCHVSTGTCSKGSKLIPMLQKIPASKRDSKLNSVICPDGSECPDGQTCCELASGGYGCCPLPEAVCCKDKRHCCPNGYTCNVQNGTCRKEAERVSLLVTLSAAIGKGNLSNVVCPDGQSECPDGNTCCKLSSGQWGCCPLPKAVCCSDGVHCCPNGYTCDVSAGTCSKGSKLIPMLEKIPALQRKGQVSIVCPDGQSECPDDNTCCKLSSGQWGCCPLPKAVCCSDGVHCCPNGYTCDVSEGTCSKGSKLISMLQKMPALKGNSEVSVVCPDGQSECPDGSTCCKLSSGQWGCCPLPKAVCCSDGEHCCPDGYTCDVSAETCNKGAKSIPMLQKVPASKTKAWLKSIICPGDKVQCPDNETCCKLKSGEYGCCPSPDAVCCSDGEHCCPHGYTCDLSAEKCVKDKKVLALKTVLSKKSRSVVKKVVCPDGQSECPDGNTCCKLSSGQWGCCPLPNAVCCSDGEHCCPYGYICNVSAGTCYKGFDNIAVLQKMKAAKTVAKVGNVICPDGQSECPDGNTCCKLASGQYGCCPLPDAVCCSDGEHCCPNGYTCDVSAGTCSKGSKLVPMLEKIPALQRKSQVSIFCPDGQSECPDGNTCCKLSSGQWGCCPLPNAVCCSDGEHCCPNGYTCNVSAGTCSKGIKTTRMLKKMPASKRTAEVNIVCPDSQSQCPDGDTCCKLASGVWGCCPLPNAVCCIDGIHCCPEGYTCNVSSGQCQSHSEQTVVSVTQLAGKVGKDVNTVFCPDGESECPDGYTCCRDTSGKYGCCLGEDATCCSDKDHCCPKGYTCLSNGTCHQSSEQIVQSVITFAKFPGSVVCPDKKYQCPNGSTCCKLHSGSYGCCPLENAVCCSDDKHCCPEGYACDVKQG